MNTVCSSPQNSNQQQYKYPSTEDRLNEFYTFLKWSSLKSLKRINQICVYYIWNDAQDTF